MIGMWLFTFAGGSVLGMSWLYVMFCVPVASFVRLRFRLYSFANTSFACTLIHRLDDTIYDTVFQTTTHFALIIRVYLPSGSSNCPSFTLHGVRATHSWLDIRQKVIGYPPILSDQAWRDSGLKLGDAVYAVIHTFQINPPTVEEITDANLKRLQDSLGGTRASATAANLRASANSASTASANSAPSAYLRPTASIYTPNARGERLVKSVQTEQQPEVDDDEVNALIPSIPTSFPKLDNMTMSELKQLFNDDSVFEDFVKNTSEVSTLNELKESIEQSNIAAAEGNWGHKFRLEEQRARLDTLQKDLSDKFSTYKQLLDKKHKLTSPPDVRDAIHELHHAKKEVFRESEAIAEEWVETGGDVQGFVKDFMERRLLYHVRAAKAERLEMSM